MKTIWKFKFTIGDTVICDIPKDAQIIHVESQGDYSSCCVWAIVDPTAELERVTFAIFGTGAPIPNLKDLMYIGSWRSAIFVWHLFRVMR